MLSSGLASYGGSVGGACNNYSFILSNQSLHLILFCFFFFFFFFFVFNRVVTPEDSACVARYVPSFIAVSGMIHFFLLSAKGCAQYTPRAYVLLWGVLMEHLSLRSTKIRFTSGW